MLSVLGLRPRVSRNLLDIKFAWEPQSSKILHDLGEPLLSNAYATAVDRITLLSLSEPVADVARTVENVAGLFVSSVAALVSGGLDSEEKVTI